MSDLDRIERGLQQALTIVLLIAVIVLVVLGIAWLAQKVL